MHSIERIEIFSQWTGFADPPAHAAKLVVSRCESKFVRELLPERIIDDVPAALITGLEEALARPVVPQLDPAMFDLPEMVLRAHYDSTWTDDYAGHLVEIRFSGGRAVKIRTDDQHAFMLPLQVSGRRPGRAPPVGRRGINEPAVESTFDPRLSRAIAMLMPEGYLEKDRLAGILGMLTYDLAQWERREEPSQDARAVAHNRESGDACSLTGNPTPAGQEGGTECDAESVQRWEGAMQEIFRIVAGVESPEEIAAAERAGKLSERLLKRISAEVARDLVARGANPNIADDMGQTALMHAAFPPFNGELFRLLVQSGASLEARRQDGFTGLHLACAGGEAEAAEEWVRAGADVSSRLPDGTTPLMLGATCPRIVRSLLAAGADVNSADDQGQTALVYAIARQSSLDGKRMLSALRVLLDAGADVNQPDRDGVTPQVHARRALARVELEEEVFRAFHANAGASRARNSSAMRLAETVVEMVGRSGL